MLLDDYLKSHGLTRNKLAVEAGVSPSAFQYSAKTDDPAAITKRVKTIIADTLGKTMAEVSGELVAMAPMPVAEPHSRSYDFGRAYGLLQATARFAGNTELEQQIQQAAPRFMQTPATVISELFAETTAQTFPFPQLENIQQIIVAMADDDYSDNPLTAQYMAGAADSMTNAKSAGEQIMSAPTQADLEALDGVIDDDKD